MKKDIHEYANDFNVFIENRFPDFTKQIVDKLLMQNVNVYLFSGVIRDYFLYKDSSAHFKVRDLDIVVSDIDKFKSIYQNRTHYEVNSFGGLKLFFNDITIDVWQVDKTWGLTALDRKYFNKNSELLSILPETVFFNCSSILFDFQKKYFIENDQNSFQAFLENKMLDIVLEANPLPELCVINTVYYAAKHNLSISRKLAKYIENQFNAIERDKFERIQQKHFNKIKYRVDNLEEKIQQLIISAN